MLKKPVLTLLSISVATLVLLLFRSAADIEWLDSMLFSYRNSVIEPLEFVSIFLIATTIYLLLFNQTIQQSWWRWARFVQIVPFALIILLLPMYQNGGGFINFGGTTELVILWGVVFVITTLVYTLWQRFWLKAGVI
jgi:hypothetical protein